MQVRSWASITSDQLRQSAPGPHLLPAAVGRDRPLRGSSQRRPVVVEVAGRIHLVLRRETRTVESARAQDSL